MTDVKPASIARMQLSTLVPWSRWSDTGTVIFIALTCSSAMTAIVR